MPSDPSRSWWSNPTNGQLQEVLRLQWVCFDIFTMFQHLPLSFNTFQAKMHNMPKCCLCNFTILWQQQDKYVDNFCFFQKNPWINGCFEYPLSFNRTNIRLRYCSFGKYQWTFTLLLFFNNVEKMHLQRNH